MRLNCTTGLSGLLIAAIFLIAGEAVAAPAASTPPIKVAASHHRNAIEHYARARGAYEKEAAAYWDLISEKRRARFAKRRSGETVTLDDYVLTQPPLYTGPPRPKGFSSPRDPNRPHLPPIPTVADFLRHAAQQFHFRPDRPSSDAAFKQAYARVALAAGLTREQAVRIYAFETGGNGTYDVQAGLTSPHRPDARPISPAIGYNQLLSTNSVSLLAEHGDRFVAILQEMAVQANGDGRKAMERKIEALQRMVAFSRTVPNNGASRTGWPSLRPAAWASMPRCSTATSARCCRPRSCSIRCVFAKQQGPHAAADRGRARTDELHRRRQRLRPRHDAA